MWTTLYTQQILYYNMIIVSKWRTSRKVSYFETMIYNENKYEWGGR